MLTFRISFKPFNSSVVKESQMFKDFLFKPSSILTNDESGYKTR